MKAIINSAYHESGHAVICVLNEVLFPGKTSIIADEKNNELGRTYSNSHNGKSVEAMKAMIMVNFAGGLAESILLKQREESSIRNIGSGAREDYSSVLEIVETLFKKVSEEETINSIILPIRKRTHGLLKANWEYVKAVAEELLKEKEISGLQVEAIVFSLHTKDVPHLALDINGNDVVYLNGRKRE